MRTSSLVQRSVFNLATRSRARYQVPTYIATWLIAALVLPAEGRTWLVEADGSGDTVTIQEAIEASALDDTILVGVGTYNENLDTLSKRLTIRSAAGATVTVIDGGLHASVVRFTGGGRVEGLCLRGGLAFAGGGLYVAGTGSTEIRNNILEGNFAGFSVDEGLGGGIFLDKVTNGVLVEANIIRNNAAGDSGGGIYDEGGFTTANILRRNTIVENSCFIAGAGVSTFGSLLEFNLILRNHSEHFGGGVHVRSDGVSEVRQNTIVGNTVLNFMENGAGVHLNGGGLVRNNIVANNKYAGAFGPQSGAGIFCTGLVNGAQVTCNVSWGNDVDDEAGCLPDMPSNFVADPLFCDAANDVYTLSNNSPCLPSSACGLIGALGVGCGSTGVESHTWTDMKRMFR